jgi:hypothetical protein
LVKAGTAPITVSDNLIAADATVRVIWIGGSWSVAPIGSSGATTSDETGQGKPAAPVSAPANPSNLDIHIEKYDYDFVVWKYDGTTWNNSLEWDVHNSYSSSFLIADWVADADGHTLEVLETTHLQGGWPLVQVYFYTGSEYQKINLGHDCTGGDIDLKLHSSVAPFNGLIKISKV